MSADDPGELARRPLVQGRTCPKERLAGSSRKGHDGLVADAIDREDLRAIILALMRIDEKLDELLGEDDYDDGEEEDLA